MFFQQKKILTFSFFLKKKKQSKHEFLLRNESVLNDAPFDMRAGLASRTVHEFDKAVVVPLHQFNDVDEYYTKASSGSVIDRITIPLLAFGAADDPICAKEAIPHEKCAGLILIFKLLILKSKFFEIY